jgi:hypothetical protein
VWLLTLLLAQTWPQVAPILHRQCAPCHRPGQIAPFALLEYQDAAPRAAQIAELARRRYMPPWKAQPTIPFQGERRLTESEIAQLTAWAKSGAPRGTRKVATPAFPESEWERGAPDLIVEMPRPFAVAADGPDVYQCFAVPLALKEDRWVHAFEFQPGNRKVVHHALFFTDLSNTARSRDTGAGYPCFGVPGFLPASSLGGWSPGNRSYAHPEGTAVRLPARSVLVFQIHYHASGRPEQDRSRVGLYFAPGKPARRVIDVALASRHIDIPAGVKAFTVTDSYVLPVDVWLHAIIPHAHYVCTKMRGRMRRPDGSVRTLLAIDDWDFNWQEPYRLVKPLRLAAGTRLEMEFTYDNSEANPRNPHHPPRRVTWGYGVEDEMAGLHYQVTVVNDADLEELSQSLWGKMMRYLQR